MERDKRHEKDKINENHQSELDAVHNRFVKPPDSKVLLEYQYNNHYYCEKCKLFFAPTVLGLKTHFKEDMTKHDSYGPCFYCEGKVFVYKLRNEKRFYHNCAGGN